MIGEINMNNLIYNSLIKKGFINPNNEEYLWLPEMIWFAPDKLDYYNNDRYDYLRTEGLFLFAKNAYGDFFAWNKDDESVLFCDQGSGYGFLYAPNLEGAIFRRIIEFANGDYVDFCFDDKKEEMDEDEAEGYISETQAISMLKEYKKSFGEYFQSGWIDALDRIIQNGLIDENGFISESQKTEIISSNLNYEQLNMSINLN